MDSKGIVSKDRGDELPGHKLIVARETNDIKTKDLHEVVKAVKPHALIGLTGRGPAFSKVLTLSLRPHQTLSSAFYWLDYWFENADLSFNCQSASLNLNQVPQQKQGNCPTQDSWSQFEKMDFLLLLGQLDYSSRPTQVCGNRHA